MDEAHERTLDIDFALLLMKQSLLSRQTNARLVVMGAASQANVFADYFAPVQRTAGVTALPCPEGLLQRVSAPKPPKIF